MCEWILQLLGTPTESDLGFTHNEDAKRYIRQLPNFPRQPLAKLFSHVNPLAIDLVDKMLTFDPNRRITGKSYLSVSYICSTIMDWFKKKKKKLTTHSFFFLLALFSWRSFESPVPRQVARPKWWANLSKAILFRIRATASRWGTDKGYDLQRSHSTQSNICLEEQQHRALPKYPSESLLSIFEPLLLFMFYLHICNLVILFVCSLFYYCECSSAVKYSRYETISSNFFFSRTWSLI